MEPVFVVMIQWPDAGSQEDNEEENERENSM